MRITIPLLALLATAACNPGDATTDNTTTLSPSTSLDPSNITTSGTPTTTGDASTTNDSTGEQIGGACDGIPDDDECMCAPADDAFCADLDAFCRDVVHLDLSGLNPPGTDYCDTIGSWCASPGVSTFSACELLESTCLQVAPSGNVKDCKGLRDACACDGFVVNMPGGTTTGGEDTTTGGSTGEKVDNDTGACDAGECANLPCIWTHIPVAGAAWGPCLKGDKCTEEGTECHTDGIVSVCLPSCGGGECPEDLCGGVCRDDGGACIPACEFNNDCPFPGMQCSLSAGPLSFCGWL